LLNAETNLNFDLNADGTTGLTYSPGLVTINDVNLGSNPLGFAIKHGATAPLQISFSGQYASPSNPGAGWTPIAAATSSSGYDLYWKNSSSNQFARWNLNSSAELITANLLSTADLYDAESSFNTDLNGDSITGLPFTGGIAIINGIDLGTSPLGYAIKPSNNSPVTVTYSGQNASTSFPGGGWSAIAAAASPGGFQLYWRNITTDQYALWNLGNNGSYSSGTLLSQSDLLTAEASLNYDLNRDGTVGILVV
jgi:hypothetical protein